LPEGDAAIVDIFRFEEGRIAEAEDWDVVQPNVPAEKTVSGNPMVWLRTKTDPVRW
jgi:predicted SnoaL-like aldol condensation-catalyzing enzyme